MQATYGLTLDEVAVRRLVHHSQMRSYDLDIIYGASKLTQLDESLAGQNISLEVSLAVLLMKLTDFAVQRGRYLQRLSLLWIIYGSALTLSTQSLCADIWDVTIIF